MKNIIIFLCLCTICMCRLHAADSSRADSLLLKLDQAIKERPIYMEQKELKLAELKRQLHRQIPDEERFAILGTLLDEYRSFNTDSALHMAEEREQIAIRLGNREYIETMPLMNKADVLGRGNDRYVGKGYGFDANIHIGLGLSGYPSIITISTVRSMALRDDYAV